MRMYLPPDTNCLLSCFDHCIKSKNYVNVIVASKHPSMQWLTMDQAVVHCTQGIGIWDWASSDQGAEPDLVMACCGDTPTLEALAATTILRDSLPDIKIRFVNVVDLMRPSQTGCTKPLKWKKELLMRNSPTRTKTWPLTAGLWTHTFQSICAKAGLKVIC